MIASHHICISVHGDQLYFQEFAYCWIAQMCKHFVCDSIWSRYFLCCCVVVVFSTGWAAWSSLSVRHSCRWSGVISESSSLFVSVLLLFGFTYWRGCYLHLRSCQIVWYSPVCQSPYHQSLPRCCNSLNVLFIQLFDKSPSFWSSLSRFVEVASVCLEKLAHIYSTIIAGCA